MKLQTSKNIIINKGDLIFYQSWNSITIDWDCQLIIILEVKTEFSEGDYGKYAPIHGLHGDSSSWFPYPIDEWYTLTLISKGEFTK